MRDMVQSMYTIFLIVLYSKMAIAWLLCTQDVYSLYRLYTDVWWVPLTVKSVKMVSREFIKIISKS